MRDIAAACLVLTALFRELHDEILDAVPFVLIGMEVLLVAYQVLPIGRVTRSAVMPRS